VQIQGYRAPFRESAGASDRKSHYLGANAALTCAIHHPPQQSMNTVFIECRKAFSWLVLKNFPKGVMALSLSAGEVLEAPPGPDGLETSDGLLQAMERFPAEVRPEVA
jgi:hypothetical protein